MAKRRPWALGCTETSVLPHFPGLSPTNGYRCKIPSCDNDTFSFDDYDPGLLFPSLDPNNSVEYDPDNPDYCR